MSSESVSVSLRCSLMTSGKGIDIYLPPMARPFMHLAPRSQSPPRATARMCPCPCALRSALSTARLPHEVNKEQADTALRCGIGLHVGLNTARGRVSRVPSRNQKGASSRTQPHIPQKSKRGKATRSIGRTGEPEAQKGEIFPFYPIYAIFNQVFTFLMSGKT